MQHLPDAYAALVAYNQFILWIAVPRKDGGIDKLPIDWRSGKVANAHDPAIWTSLEIILIAVKLWGEKYNIGWALTVTDPFYLGDLDKCLMPDGTWSPVAVDIMTRLPGAAVEVSTSGQGLHIIGQGVVPDHGCRNDALGIEFYTEKRFLTLTGTNVIGSASTDNTLTLTDFVNTYFPPKITVRGDEWNHKPVAEWNGYTGNKELIGKALTTATAASTFGDTASFQDLWGRNFDKLASCYPDAKGEKPYNASAADAALAQHLAFWTGCHHERIFILMWTSKLIREKWNRDDYLIRTITNACAMQKVVYMAGGKGKDSIIKLSGSDKAKKYASNVIDQKLLQCTDAQREQLLAMKGSAHNASFWIDNKDRTIEDLITITKPIEAANSIMGDADNGPEFLAGYQFLNVTQQAEHFKGCTYIADMHRVLTSKGSLYRVDQFNSVYGGYSFQIDTDGGGKTTKKAWEAFVESQAVRYPKADLTCFRPDLAPGVFRIEEGKILINAYVPINTPRKSGDITPFLAHLAKVLPDEHDRQILLAYMAACVQYKGIKFQWAPLIQGAEGNGKTLFTRCVMAAVGKRYSHLPQANDIDNKFNGWMLNKLFIGIEDIYVSDQRHEIIEALKPMITNTDIEIQLKGIDQVTMSSCANFILNCNDKAGFKKTKNDRRFAMFYTAQQSEDDITRDGMGGDYFPTLYNWLKADGYAIVSQFLESYIIPEALNPATQCHRAPITSTTYEAINASLGTIEQEILEAIEESRVGFMGGWVSSTALDRLLQNMAAARKIPQNKRREMLQTLGYDWHPALYKGRANNPIIIDDGKKPRLYIKNGHIHANLTNAADVSKLYQEAQGVLVTPRSAFSIK